MFFVLDEIEMHLHFALFGISFFSVLALIYWLRVAIIYLRVVFFAKSHLVIIGM